MVRTEGVCTPLESFPTRKLPAYLLPIPYSKVIGETIKSK